VIVVTAPNFLQDQRLLKRPGMTRQRLNEILAKQMPDAEKRRRADFVVQTGNGKRATRQALARILDRLK
jgi:dephospho-CoA kinase